MAVTEGLDFVPLDGRLGSAAMEASSEKGVTPQGVRAGDPAALQALVDRRGPAVIAFCTQVCGPPAADRAAAEAFARFRAAVRDAPDLKLLEPEALLRGATRHAAASMARQPSGPPPHGKLRSRGTETCVHVPTMLAARANGALGPADLERLARHLDRCERCNALRRDLPPRRAVLPGPAGRHAGDRHLFGAAGGAARRPRARPQHRARAGRRRLGRRRAGRRVPASARPRRRGPDRGRGAGPAGAGARAAGGVLEEETIAEAEDDDVWPLTTTTILARPPNGTTSCPRRCSRPSRSSPQPRPRC